MPLIERVTPAETLTAVSRTVHALVEQQHRCFLEELALLAVEGVGIVRRTR